MRRSCERKIDKLEEELMSENGDEAGWNFSKDGILWQTVAPYFTSIIKQKTRVLVEQLQESVGPVDALQGLLLDRIAAGYFRKARLIEVQGTTGLCDKLVAPDHGTSSTDQVRRLWSANLLRYESLLDQGFHRDLILLLQLKKAASNAPALSAKKPPKSDRGLIEGQANSNVADQAIGSSAVKKLSPVAPGSEVEQSEQDRRRSNDIYLE
jgi:hypothetical protein